MTHDDLKNINEQLDGLEDIANVIVVRKGTTNGDVIMGLYPDGTVHPWNEVNQIVYAANGGKMMFTIDWWNTPYGGQG